jgi:hypothetical protein
VTPEPLPPPWAKPGGHEPGPGFTVKLKPGPVLIPAIELVPEGGDGDS